MSVSKSQVPDVRDEGSETTIPIPIGTVLTNRNGIQRLHEVGKQAHLCNVSLLQIIKIKRGL